MFKKYSNQFEEIYQRWVMNKESPLEIIKDYISVFDKQGVGVLEMIGYLEKYLVKDGFDREHLILE